MFLRVSQIFRAGKASKACQSQTPAISLDTLGVKRAEALISARPEFKFQLYHLLGDRLRQVTQPP